MTNTYARAYTELIALLKYLPKEEFNKIPKEKIDFYEKNKDTDYKFVYDPSKSFEEQNVSQKTSGIIVMLFRDYFANDIQKEKLKNILKQNEVKKQEESYKKYNPDNLFKKKIDINNEEQLEKNNNEKMLMVIEKENIFKRIINKLKSLFNKIYK